MQQPISSHREFMKRSFILAAILTLGLLGALVYLYGGGQTPAGQPPLQKVTQQNIAGIENAFNSAKHKVRVLLLLSPT